MSSSFRGGAALLLVGFLADPAAALVRLFTINPSDPVMGEAVLYVAGDDGCGPMIASYKWEYKYTSGSCQGNWIESGWTGYYAMFIESRPGTWDVRLTVTYEQDSSGDPPHEPTVIINPVTIAPATKFTTIAGLDNPAAYTNDIVLKFRVEAASRPCGPYVSYNLAQERITDRWQKSPPYTLEYPPDSDWVPDVAITDFEFQPSTNEIWDSQGVQLSAENWATIQESLDFLNCTQHLRIKYVDPCGETKTISLGSHNLSWKKVDSNNWQVTEF